MGYWESEDEDLHQCGRCMAMFRRLSDYFDHKQRKSCCRYLHSVEELPVPDNNMDVDVANVVQQSLQASFSDNECLQTLPSPTCDEEDTTEALEPVVDNDVTLVNTTDGVSHDSSAEDRHDSPVVDSTSTDEQLVASEDHSGVVVTEGLPEAPPPHQCPQCDFTSKFRDDFDQHLRRQHGLSTHVCEDCSRAYTDAYKLRRHQKLYCTKTPARKKQNVLLPAAEQQHQQQLAPRFLALDKRKKSQLEEGGGTTDSPFRCRMCIEVFDDYDRVKSHVADAHSTIAKPGICRFCGAWFANPYKLRRHVSSSVHDDVASDALTSFKRQIDRMSISCTPEALRLLRRARTERRQQHLAETTSGNECSVCRQTFSARSALLRHRRVVHGRRSATDAAPSISCQLCGASFDRRRAYLRHRRDEHRKLPVVRAPAPSTKNCPVCDRSFARADAAAKHHATVHSARQQLPDCVLSLTQPLTHDHTLPDTEPDSSTASCTCFVCAQPSPSRTDLVRHLELFHRVWVPQRDGPVPPGLFDDMPAIPASLQHIDAALAATQTQRLSMPSPSSPPCEESEEQIVPDRQVTSSQTKCRGSGVSPHWTCPYCSQHSTFNTLDALYRHKVDYHRLDAVFRCVVTSCRITFQSLADYEAHVASSGHNQAAFICPVCNEHCVGQPALKSHRGSAHHFSQLLRPRHCGDVSQSKKSGSILCDQCGRTFTKRAALMNHRAVVHKRDSCRRYACSQCERRFVKREHLQRHVASQHGTARPYVCRAAGCGRAFKRKDKLQEHYRCHSTERLYSCTLCGRTYRQRDGLRHHVRAHHRPTSTDRPERRRNCRRCPATFTRAGKLAEHLRTVHGRGAGKDVYAHRCDVCGKTFPRPERVRRHAEREHNVPADWSHRCAVCGKGFAGRRSYELHVARHNADGGADGVIGGGGATTPRRCRRRTKAKSTTSNKTPTTETSPRVVVVSGRHQSRVTASCDVTRVEAAVERQTDAPSTSHCFNRFFVPSTHRHQFEQTSEARSSRLSSRVSAQTASLDRLYSSERDRVLSQCPATERLRDAGADNLGTHRRLSFEPLPYLRHPTRTTNDYSYYASGYHHHRPATPHRTQFGLYPSAPTGFGYSSHHSAAACAAAPRGYGLFTADRAPSATALPFGVQSAERCLAGQSVERRPTDFSAGLATPFPSVMTGNYTGSSGSAAPLRPLATQPPSNTYCPVPDPPTVGRWFDSVPTLLPTPVDAPNLDSVCWPPRPCIDSLTVRPRYPFSIEPPGTSRSHDHHHSTVPPARDTPSTVAGPPCLSSVERSCLLNCSRMDSAAGPHGLMLGPRRRAVDGQIGVETMSLGHRDAPSNVPSHHGMLPLLPPW